MPELLRASMGPVEDVIVIHNPASGVRNSIPEVERAATSLQNTGWRVDIWPTEGPGHATDLAKNAAFKRASLVIVASGDGGFREAAKGLLDAKVSLDTDIPALASLPTGTVNVLAREMGTPSDTVAAAQALRYGRLRLMDTGEVNNEVFLLNAGGPADATVFRELQKPGRRKKARGLLPYVGPFLKIVPRFEGVHGTLTIGEEEFEDTFTQVWAGNTRRLSHFSHWPGAQIDDRVHEITAITGNGRQLIRRFLAGALMQNGERPGTIYRQAPAMELRLDKEIPVQADGDSLPLSNVIRTRVVPDSLVVLTPAGPNDLFSRV